MKILGIDYGTKRIGIAISDDSGKFAFPKSIITSGSKALGEIITLIQSEQVERVVVGNSVDQSGMRNILMEDIDVFIEELHKLTGLPIELADERFSSSAVRAFDFEKPIANTRGNSRPTGLIDDRAAAIMLQRYLDRL